MLIHNLKNGINERNHGSIDVKVQKIVSPEVQIGYIVTEQSRMVKLLFLVRIYI